ncbi:hypothetical protein Ancab_038118 [Ancistrocladus abbreviatus]
MLVFLRKAQKFLETERELEKRRQRRRDLLPPICSGFSPICTLPTLLEENLDVGCLEVAESGGLGFTYGQLLNPENFSFEEFSEELQTPHFILPSLEDKVPFLQMLQSIESPSSSIQEPNFQYSLRLQQQRQLLLNCYLTSTGHELESCVTTNEIMELNSPVKLEAKEHEFQAELPNSTENLSPECNQFDHHHEGKSRGYNSILGSTARGRSKQTQLLKCPPITKERRKRKRARPVKNKEDVESQRMTHIAVERNRRRQMNDHLNALRTLLPPSYTQRGDQASIIGGAIDYVKELEQLLQSLQAEKRMKQSDQENGDVSASSSCSSPKFHNDLFTPSSLRNSKSHGEDGSRTAEGPVSGGKSEEFTVENRSAVADVRTVMIRNHVNLKIQCQRREGQLVKAILAMEELRLTVLHLNITSLQSLVHYSFNLKVEDDCQLRTAEQITEALHHIFSLSNTS